MRARMILGAGAPLVLGLLSVPTLCVGQHAHQFEIGAFASFTRYDRAFNLDNQFGGGGRLGYFFGPAVSVEFELGYQQPTPRGGGASTTLGLGGASLVLNAGNEHNLFYILGGYTRMRFADNPAYTFNDNGFHGAIGDRMFLGEPVAPGLPGRRPPPPQTTAASVALSPPGYPPPRPSRRGSRSGQSPRPAPPSARAPGRVERP